MDHSNIKPFHCQFGECKKEGFLTETEFESFEEHPEWLPRFPRLSKLKKMMEAIESGELKGMSFYKCGRFGGRCNSGNKECRNLRGWNDANT
jgi:hypothetical protein